MSSCDCPYLSAPALACARFQWRSSVSDFTGAAGPRLASHLLKSRFMPYLKTTEHPASAPFGPSVPRQTSQRRKLRVWSFSTTAGISGGLAVDGAPALGTGGGGPLALR